MHNAIVTNWDSKELESFEFGRDTKREHVDEKGNFCYYIRPTVTPLVVAPYYTKAN